MKIWCVVLRGQRSGGYRFGSGVWCRGVEEERLGCEIQGLVFKVHRFGFSIYGSELRIQHLGFGGWVWGSRVWDTESFMTRIAAEVSSALQCAFTRIDLRKRESTGFRVLGFGFWGQGSWLRAEGSELRVEGEVH